MKKFTIITGILIFISGLAIYWSSAYPSITWWETSEYATAAVGLGITGPPGSLLITLAGWLISRLAGHNPAYLLNLFAGIMGSLSITLLFTLYMKTRSESDHNQENSRLVLVILFLTGCIILCSTTLWEYSVMFVPYIVTGLFTVLILHSVVKWWKIADSHDSWRHLFLIAFLFGLDFSVHRTNAVLIPGVAVLVLIRKPSVFVSLRSYILALSGLMAGLSPQLIYLPLAHRDPSMNMGLTPSFSGLWYYFSLKQYGGNFLLDIIHRKGPLFSYQIPYYFKGLADNFFYFDKSTVLSGFIPGLLGVAGIYSLIRRDRKFGLALFSLLLLTIIVSIIYFNLPENYFRTIYRHYLPTFLIFSFFIFEGAGFVFRYLSGIYGRSRIVLSCVLVIMLCASLTVQFNKGYSKNNGSGKDEVREHARGILQHLEEGGILFTYGDNDYFPVLYMQEAEKLRKDVICLNLSLLNADWYITGCQRHYPGLPLSGKGYDITKFEFRDWKTENAVISLDDEVGKKYGLQKDTVNFSLPAIRRGSNYLQDLAVFDIIRTNSWKKPVYFMKSGFEKELVDWLRPYLKDEGLVYKLVPDH